MDLEQRSKGTEASGVEEHELRAALAFLSVRLGLPKEAATVEEFLELTALLPSPAPDSTVGHLTDAEVRAILAETRLPDVETTATQRE